VDFLARLHQDSIVCDLHADSLQWVAAGGSLGGHAGHLDLPRARAGGLDLQFFSVWVDVTYLPKNGEPDRSFARACELLDAFDRETARHADAMAPVTCATDARRIVAEGKLAAALGVEGGHAIESDLDKLEEFYRRGVRYLTLTWNNSTDWAQAAKVENQRVSPQGGLSPLGEEIVRRMNQLGMIVDLSHAAESTFWDVLRVSEAPVMASHSNAFALSPHDRNLKDAQIRALAERGGIIGINFYSSFLDANYARRREEAEERRRAELEALEREMPYDYPTRAARERELLQAEMGYVPVPASRVADHIEHIARLVGPDHVALGSDFDGTNAVPDDIPDVSHLPVVTRLLHERGISECDIRKILGGNVLRFFESVCG
jgi:membrane dipeptidase